MKLLVISTILLAGVCLAANLGSPSSSVANPVLEDPRGRNREGRILATYSMETKDNTAAALPKLDTIIGKLGNLNDNMGLLLGSQTATGPQMVTLLTEVKNALGSSGSLATQLGLVATSFSNVVSAVFDPTNNASYVSLMVGLNNIFDQRLQNIEKILGYDDFPPAPLGRALTSS